MTHEFAVAFFSGMGVGAVFAGVCFGFVVDVLRPRADRNAERRLKAARR